ncbi:MAG: TIGR03915 family putative DNA repair protein [Ferruginibacter sp.]|nr:TIGR03915 family putative DNA repair protein [Cytophagales bacterium]
MTFFVYDGSFEGLLTAVFDVYVRRAEPARLVPAAGYQPDALGESTVVFTDETKANRVWRGLQKRISTAALVNVYACYLSELPEREELLLSFVRQVFAAPETAPGRVEENYGSPAVLRVAQLGRQLFREKHRFEAFVRFQQLRDGSFYATIDPDFNVLPLITAHFVQRYADQVWIIYDARRKYGVYYDKTEAREVRFDFAPPDQPAEDPGPVYDEQEELYQLLWRVYFQNVNIPARRNPKLHRRHVPIRYWKYLLEKQPRERPTGRKDD